MRDGTGTWIVAAQRYYLASEVMARVALPGFPDRRKRRRRCQVGTYDNGPAVLLPSRVDKSHIINDLENRDGGI
jgi:hypothetical protein